MLTFIRCLKNSFTRYIQVLNSIIFTGWCIDVFLPTSVMFNVHGNACLNSIGGVHVGKSIQAGYDQISPGPPLALNASQPTTKYTLFMKFAPDSERTMKL